MTKRSGMAVLLLAAGVFASKRASAALYYYGGPGYERPAYTYRGPNGAALGPYPWNFDFGGGPTSIAGGPSHVLNPGWNFELGGGYNFTPATGFVFEYMDHGMGLDSHYLDQNQAIDGYAHIWSFTVNPIWRYRIAGRIGGYLIGGGGFYEREINLTQPATFFVPGPYGGYVSGNELTHQTDDTGGLNIGAGFTFHLGYATKLFVEARYHYIFTSGGATRLIPVTIGFRW